VIVRATEDSTKSWCLPLNSLCFVPLYDISPEDVREVADWIADMVSDYTGYDED